MYIRKISSGEQSQNRLGWTILGLLLGVVGSLCIYAFFNLNLGFPSNSSHYDTGENSGNIPSVGDYLFGTGGSGSELSGTNISGEIVTGAELVYPTGYLDEYKKALIILQNDSNVNTYIDTDNLISSGFNLISISPIQKDNGTSFRIQGNTDPSIEKLYIVGSYKNGAYYFDSIPLQGNLFQHQIDANSGSLKPSNNTYYLIGKTAENKYVIQYIKYTAKEGVAFYQSLNKICILDVCSEPGLPFVASQGSDTLVQQSLDKSTVVQIIPDISITIAHKDPSAPSPSIRKIRKIGNYYQKTFISGGEPSITQKVIDKDGNPVNASTAGISLPSKLTFGNLKYITPIVNFENSNKTFNKVAKIDAGFVIEDTKKNLKVANDYSFLSPDGIYVTYTLDNSSLKVINPSNSDGSYKIIPKVAERMKNAIVYTIPSTDIGMHDTISSYFKGSVVEKTATCANNKPNSDPNAKFGLFPIDGQYDIVGLWNCYGVK